MFNHSIAKIFILNKSKRVTARLTEIDLSALMRQIRKEEREVGNEESRAEQLIQRLEKEKQDLIAYLERDDWNVHVANAVMSRLEEVRNAIDFLREDF